MTDTLSHDPRTKQQIKDAIYSFLYQPTEKQMKLRLDTLIVKNAVIGGYTHKSFMHKNILYNCDATALPRKMNRLVPQLYEDMAEYLKDLKQLNEREVPYVVGYINQVLNSSNDLCDYLKLLPEAVHNPIKHLIATCPCRNEKLPQETVQMLQKKNQTSIDLMKQRMVLNLLI